jgi:hypothetical protein
MKLLENNKIKIINQYMDGQSIASLAREYNVNQWSIKNLFIKNNIKIRTLADLKIKFNENFFFDEKEETYYFWGFMLGDGCLITHKQGHKYITISIKNIDECILLNFCKWLKIDSSHIKHGVNNYKTQYSRLELYGNFFKQDFSKYGLVSNKTYNPVIPQLEGELVKPFLLGLIDADGSVFWNKKEHSVQLVGHPLVMDWVINQLRKLGFDGNINEQLVKNKWKRIRIQRKEDILQVVKYLNLKQYYHICLPRKWYSLYEFIIQL